MEITTIAITTLVKSATEAAVRRVSEFVANSNSSDDWAVENIARHQSFVVNWAASYQMLGMAEAKDTAVATVSLDYGLGRVRVPEATESTISISEQDILDDQHHYLVLGDPGSGKTTTIKRLCLALLATSASSSSSICQYPIVVRVRDFERSQTLFTAIATAIGIKFQSSRVLDRTNGVESLDYSVGATSLTNYVTDLLNSTSPAIFVDGIDEADPALRGKLLADLQRMALSASNIKIVASIRSGEMLQTLQNFRIVRVKPLTPKQQEQIQSQWIKDPGSFRESLLNRPYKELCSRPLFLAHLILLYSRTRSLPDQASDVYEDILRLALQDWDRDQGIARHSKYSDFGPAKKMRFLSALSYTMTLKTKQKTFNSRALAEAYLQIHDSFALPEEEADLVAAELETHTGIISWIRDDMYEFSHLTMQEFLCAQHIVRDAFPALLTNYLSSYPAPLAVAVAIASNPGNYLSRLLLQGHSYEALREGGLDAFLERIAFEAPRIVRSAVFGLAMCRVIMDSWIDGQFREPLLEKLASARVLYESIGDVLSHYLAVPNSSGPIQWRSRMNIPNNLGINTPEILTVPREVVVHAVARAVKPLLWRGEQEVMHPLRLAADGSLHFDVSIDLY